MMAVPLTPTASIATQDDRRTTVALDCRSTENVSIGRVYRRSIDRQRRVLPPTPGALLPEVPSPSCARRLRRRLRRRSLDARDALFDQLLDERRFEDSS